MSADSTLLLGILEPPRISRVAPFTGPVVGPGDLFCALPPHSWLSSLFGVLRLPASRPYAYQPHGAISPSLKLLRIFQPQLKERTIGGVVESLEAPDVFDVYDLRERAELPGFEELFTPLTASRLRRALEQSRPSRQGARS